MKTNSIICSMTVAIFMIAIGNGFAREVDYTVKLPNGLSAHFYNWKGNNNPTLDFTDEKGALRVVCNLPDEAYWMTEYDSELIAFIDDTDNVYIGLVWDSGLAKGATLWSKDVSTTSSKWVRRVDEMLWDAKFTGDKIAIWKSEDKGYYSLQIGVYKNTNMIVVDRWLLRVMGKTMKDGRVHITDKTF